MIIINIEGFGSITYYLCFPYLTLSSTLSAPIWVLCNS